MKTKIIITILTVIAYLNANSETTISISKKNSDDPSVVCDNSIYYYVTTITDAPSGYTVSWIKTHADIPEQSTSEAKVKWTATDETEGYIGKIKAQLKTSSGTLLATSNEIEVTIKSIKHLKPELATYGGPGWVTEISPCNSGYLMLEVSPKLAVPGTGTVNPERVEMYKWILPSG
jgi:hypothetical protein